MYLFKGGMDQRRILKWISGELQDCGWIYLLQDKYTVMNFRVPYMLGIS
jgi:hypothetical protein